MSTLTLIGNVTKKVDHVGWYYLLMTNFPFKSMAVALALAFWAGYELRGML